ncbi:hypothetical protein BURPS1655_K1003 [Burkholderia pseudomallei 1655]|nr:hypothetical protein BURPS1655_K1003 [Burkholderia pseudomallei 1655]
MPRCVPSKAGGAAGLPVRRPAVQTVAAAAGAAVFSP